MSAAQPLGVDSNPASSEAAVRAQLDALAKGEIDHVTFLNNMKERFRVEPDDNWEVLSWLDQYYRRGKIKLEIFRALKSGFAELILGPQSSSANKERRTPALQTIDQPLSDVAEAGAAPSKATRIGGAAAKSAPAIAVALAPAAPVRAPAAAAAMPPASVNEAHQAPTDAVQVFAPAAGGGTSAAKATAAAPSRDVEVGDLLRNRYRLDGFIAKGVCGTVFAANDLFRLNLPPTGKRVAIKVLRLPDPRGTFIKQLRQEFHHLQQLSHPNIVRAFDFDRDGVLAFYTMEMLNGEHLSRVLQTRAIPLQRPHALAIIRDVGAAIAYAHSRGIAHGVINPQDIYITTRGEVRVLGFGAWNEASSGTATVPDFEQARPVAETYKYASCEVLQGARPELSDDVYSLSCLAYLLLTGKHPFADRTSLEARADRSRPRRHSRLSYRQWQTLRAGLQTDARKRPADVQAWLQGLELGTAAKQLPPAKELANAPAARPPRLRWAVAGMLVAALLGGGYWLYATQTTSRDVSVPRTPGAPRAETPRAETPRVETPGAETPAAEKPGVAASLNGTQAAGTATPTGRAPAATVAPAPSSQTTAKPAAPPTAPPPAVAATKVEMAVDTLQASPTDEVVHVTVRRRGNLHGQTFFTWWTESGTAKPGIDFSPVPPHVEQMQDGEGSVVLSIALLPTTHAQPKGFYVGIEEVNGGAQIGARSLTQVTLPPTS